MTSAWDSKTSVDVNPVKNIHSFDNFTDKANIHKGPTRVLISELVEDIVYSMRRNTLVHEEWADKTGTLVNDSEKNLKMRSGYRYKFLKTGSFLIFLTGSTA
uniref:DDE_Tnp_1_7 domain-containing protein n=1 Tax=Caenorhabditis tropicalis TaxID=1561998 RepID=A0A1I7UCB0_9PELO